MSWLAVRGEPVAALYGMTWGDKVYACQTGRRLDAPTAVRPGGLAGVVAPVGGTLRGGGAAVAAGGASTLWRAARPVAPAG